MNREDTISDTVWMFREILKQKRRQMTPGTRRRSRNLRIRRLWLYPYALEAQYRNYLRKLMKVYPNTVIDKIKSSLSRWLEEQKVDSRRVDNFNSEFEAMLEELSAVVYEMFDVEARGLTVGGVLYQREEVMAKLTAMVELTSDYNRKQWAKFTTPILGQPFMPDEFYWETDVIKQWATNNFTLIKSLSEEYIKKLNTIVSEGVAEGRTYNALMRDIQKMNKTMAVSRTKLIARDQIGKLNGRLTKRRQQEAGINMYEWLTAMDERVRSKHRKLQGKICQWGNDTVYKDSVRDESWKSRSAAGMHIGTPGSDIQCRCSSSPVMSDLIEEVDEELLKESEIALAV